MEKTAKELVVWDRSILPSMDNHEVYKEIRKKWKRAYKLQLQLVDEGITESMWKAPGL
jgi:autoinducer 2 (AI-2) kinase